MEQERYEPCSQEGWNLSPCWGLGVPLGGPRRVGGLLGVAGRLSGTVSPFRAEQGTSLAFTAEKSEVLLADCVSPVPFSRTPWSLQSLRIGDWLQRLNRPTFNPFRGHDVLDVVVGEHGL